MFTFFFSSKLWNLISTYRLGVGFHSKIYFAMRIGNREAFGSSDIHMVPSLQIFLGQIHIGGGTGDF